MLEQPPHRQVQIVYSDHTKEHRTLLARVWMCQGLYVGRSKVLCSLHYLVDYFEPIDEVIVCPYDIGSMVGTLCDQHCPAGTSSMDG